MKINMFPFAFAALLLLPAVSHAAAPLPDVPAAKEQAKTADKPLLVLWHGSDWLYDDAAVVEAFAQVQESGLPVVFGQFDDLTGLPNEQREKTLPLGAQFSLPLAVLLAPDGTFVAKYPAAVVRDPVALQAAVKKSLAALPRFTEQVKKARSSQGAEAAAAAKTALSLLAEDDALQHRELKELITKQDPMDASGARAAYATDHLAMYKEINLILAGGENGTKKSAERDFAKAAAYVNGIIARGKDMPLYSRQQWLAGLGYVYKEQWQSTKSAEARLKSAEAYRKCVALAPETEYGKGAAKYARYMDPDAFIAIKDMNYDSGEQTLGFEKDWHVNVTPCLQGAGTYTFRLVPRNNGGMVTRNYRLIVNGKQVATADGIDDKQNTKEVTFTVPAVPQGATVEVWLTAQCNDGWFGCSGSMEMKKEVK